MKDNLLYERVLNLNASAGTNNLTAVKVKQGRIWHVRIVSVENQTNNFTRLRIIIVDGNVTYSCFEDMSPLAGELYFSDDEIFLREGQQIQAQLQGCTAGDVLVMFVHGYWEDIE